jgi:hypothetical protein
MKSAARNLVRQSPPRSFLHASIVAACCIGGSSAWAAAPETHDIVIHNALIYDGSGGKP